MNENNYYLKKSKAVLREVRKSVIGKDDVICKVYMAIIAGGHVLLDDIPGVGKTTPASRKVYWGCSSNSSYCRICYSGKELSDS